MSQLARNYTSILESILQAFSDIAQVLPRMDKLNATFGGSPDFDQAIGLIYSDVIEFLQRTYKFFRCKRWHIWFTIHWGLFERRLNSIIHRLSRHCEVLDREAAATHFREMKDFRVKHHREEEEFEKRVQGEMNHTVIRWLSGAEDDQEEHLHRINDIRHPGTCNWVLENREMAAWIGDEGGDPVLWMTGIPGAGKSFLCSFLVEHLRTRPDRTSLYYFCGKQQTHEDTCATILRTLTCQMLRDNPDIVPLLHQKYCQRMSTRSGRAMKEMLCEVLPSAKTTRVVIDGIDENNHEVQKDTLRSLLDIQKKAGYKCKIMISSREEPEIRTILSARSHLKICSQTSEGLALFITSETEKIISHFQELKPSLVSRVEDRLRGKAQGMFLWVRLVATMLIQCISETELEQAIEQLPEGLEEAYGRILQRIDALGSKVKERAFKILFWICIAYRPITIHEVADGVVLHHGQRILSKETRSGNLKRDILDVCAPLLESSSTGVLDVVHFSAKEYLVDKQSGPFIDIAKAHFHVAYSCIVNLIAALDLTPQQGNTMNEMTLESRVTKGNFGLFPYAHECWAEHTLAYLAHAVQSDPGIREIAAALEDFSRVSKHPMTPHSDGHTDFRVGRESSAGLTKLQEYPPLHDLLYKWLVFKSQLRQKSAELVNVHAQQQWKLQKDETFLSLIDLRLSNIMEKIVMMRPSELPSHIEETDHADFIQRFKLPCRFLDCNLQFEKCEERDVHEESHILSYPCSQCDFVERGFKTRKDLDKHVRRYHMHADDFEIPASLHSDESQCNEEIAPSVNTSSTIPRCWNKEGRRVLQQGFSRILSKVESQVAIGMEENTESHKGHKARVKDIQGKIQSQRYQGLGDFKSDLNLLFGVTQGNPPSVADQQHVAMCDTEIEEAMSNYPAFATFDREASRRTILGGVCGDHDEGMEKAYPSATRVENPLSSRITFAERKPYWSVTEDVEFPELLRRCGRDFIKIADYLKTKTPAEVDQHFEDLVEHGREDLAEAAKSGALSLQGLEPIGEIAEKLDDYSSEQLEVVSDSGSFSAGLSNPDHGSVSMRPYIPELQDLSRDHRMYSRNDPGLRHPQPSASKIAAETRKSKRKQRPRALCPQCNSELHDEYAVKRHILRFHTPTRKVWNCEDISVDKRFLTKCISCSESKRYNTRRHAESHLREVHFNSETPVEVLHRWTRETEEPNPSFNSSPQPQSQGQRRKKRQKKEAEPISLPPILFDPGVSKSNPLPPISIEAFETGEKTGQSKAPTPSNGSDEERRKLLGPSKSKGPPSEKYQLLADVSFDNVLPHSFNVLQPIDSNGPAHRVDRTLIKPEQVSRLPHLDDFRKTACQDQVNALYHDLDRLGVNSARYQKVLEELVSLSRFLMRNLRDWRRHSNVGPSLPITL